MTARRRTGPGGLLVGFAVVFSLTSPLAAQGTRDSLLLGRRAYERAELDAAIRLLQIGLASAATARDTLWVGGAHMLTDALLEQGKDTLAGLWAKWILRSTPGMRVDSTAFPSRVARAFAQARSALGGGGAGADSIIVTALEPSGDPSSGRGALRLPRVSGNVIAVIESVGTMLPGESRSLRAGTYTVRITADRVPPVVIAREILPGFATVLTPRWARPATALVAAPAGGGDGAAPAASRAATVRGATFAAAGATTCTILEAGAATCWGENRDGQLGSGLADSSHHAIRVAGRLAFATISVGPTHSCALTAAGRAYCWGQGANGELGNGRTAGSAVPVAVVGTPTLVAIGAGASHSCALTASGAVYCWGSNRSGELGSNSGAQSATPVEAVAPAGVGFTSLAVGGAHACALGSTGAVYCWGENSNGQVGNGSTSDAQVPVAVQAAPPLKSVALGTTHTCGLTAAGAALCWGANPSGQLGLGAQGPLQSPRPQPVADSLSFVSLAAGEAHTCGLTQDGAAFCWGSGRSGRLGNGQQADSPRPVLVVGGQVFRSISLGTAHSCGLAADGLAWCWGDNAAGQLGALGGRASAVPVPVIARAAPHAAVANARPLRAVHETFDDGNWTVGPSWFADFATGVSMAIAEHFFEMTRSSGHLAGPGAGLAVPVHIPVTRATQVQFDVMVLPDTLRAGCGLNCATWPAVVRVRVKNTDLTESEVWYAYGDQDGRSRTLGSVVIVAKGDAEPGHWMRAERFMIRDALPRADTILQLSLGSVGVDVGARFDNIYLPVPVPSALVLTPDNAQLAGPGSKTQLRAAVFDSAGTSAPWVPVTWSSGDTMVARVDSTGQVTGVGSGRATIRAAAGAIRDSASVTVTAGRHRGPRRR